LEHAGAIGVVLELVQPAVAREISQRLAIPTIGIGSGPYCDGQILILHDVLGMLPGEAPGFAKQYVQLWDTALRAAQEFAAEVRTRRFPQGAELTNEAAATGNDAPASAGRESVRDEHAEALLADLSGTGRSQDAGR
jgi:3-methyl-2-oxobutanoate hydroxymethyltransferase